MAERDKVHAKGSLLLGVRRAQSAGMSDSDIVEFVQNVIESGSKVRTGPPVNTWENENAPRGWEPQ